MTAPLLETKFHLPTTHGRLVARARISEQITRATAATLTLVSAPAGFGKSTVMSELARHPDGAHVAWLSLEPADNDPVTFWTYVVEALDRAAPGVGSAARTILAGGPGSIDAGLTTLRNALAAIETDVVLVLDDFHVIESAAVHEQLAYVLEHLPAHAHVVIGTRADPAFPLARLRARGGLVEIRASDLRFSPAEAARYLQAMGLSLTDDDVATLEARTEGWIAALQLAALSLQGRPVRAGRGRGDHRFARPLRDRRDVRVPAPGDCRPHLARGADDPAGDRRRARHDRRPVVRHAARDGRGIAGAKSPNPAATRVRNLGTHAIYGVGLYAAAVAMSVLAG